VRDLLFGKHTFKELQESAEKIPSNILADRLKRLEREGIIAREQYQARPVRYAYYLTDKGKDLGKVMRSMVKWANKHVPGSYDMKTIKRMLEKNKDTA
jgi:DNA-binding HxlR family transcriptional regulator